MNNTEIKTVELVINSQQANKKLDEINAKLEKARQKKLEAFEKGDAEGMKVYAKEITKLEREQARLETRAKTISRVLMNMDKATPNELKRTIREINKELNSGAVERGTEQWEQLTEVLKQAKQELNAITQEQKVAKETLMDKANLFADVTQRWWAVYDIGKNTLDSISSYANQKVRDYASMEEAQAQVIKYTGMEREEVAKLNEEFKKFDTRTAREELNLLAAEAGKLNITAREEVAGYVDAANQINVALGEDLGADATKDMAQLAMMFGEDDRLGLRGSMLATASAINTVGQSSTSSEPYLASFLSEMGSVGVQAKLSQANLLGYASVLDQNKVEASVASTAFQQLTMKMFQEPAKFAEIAGQSVGDFTAMLKTDANKAMLSFLKGLAKFGDLTETAPVIKSLSLDGQKAAQTLTALSGNISKIVAEQEKANQAYNEATSVTKEYSVQNNTVQAQLEKAQKRAHDLSVELGERLYPIMANGLHIQSNLTKVLITLIDFVTKYKGTIISTAVAIAGYTAWVNASVIADKAKVFWTEKVTVAVSGLWKTLRANPWGAVIAAVGLAVSALIEYQRQQDKTTAKMRAEANIRKKVEDQYQSEADRIKTLREQIENNNLSLEFRRKRLEELKSIVPGYLADLTDEGTLVNSNTTAIDAYLKKLEKEIRLKAAREELEELYRNKRKLEKELPKAEEQAKRAEEPMKNFVPMGEQGELMLLHYSMAASKAASNLTKVKEEMKQTEEAIASLSKEINEGGLLDEDDNGDGTNKGGRKKVLTDEEIKEELKKIEGAAEIRKLAERMKYETGVTDREEYSKALLRIDADMYQAQQALYSEDSADWAKLEQKRLDTHKGIKEQEKAWSIRHLEIMQAEEEEAAKRSYLKGETTEKDHAEKMLDIRVKFLRKRADLERKAGNEEEAAKAEAQAEQLLLDDQLKRQEKYMQDLDRLRERYLTVEEGSRTAQELAILDELLRQKLIKEEEYQKLKKKIQEKGEDKQQKEEQNEFLSTPTDNISAPLIRLMEAFAALNQKIKDGEATWQDYAAVAVTSIQLVSGILSSVSQLMQANQEAEIAKVEKKYDAEIEAAGANTANGKKLEEQKQKEVAAIKTKYSKKQMKIEIAQALAQTAMAAINAYSSAAAIPVTGWIMAPIAAAAAVAAGMLQIAAIKKQHEAQQTGYYEGGFTGGTHYRRVAGEVHEGEFVANHLAVKNPQILPALRLIDQAQRNNTISSLTAADVSEALGYAPRSRGVAAPAQGGTDFVTDAAAWTAVTATMERTTDTLDSLNRLMDDGLDCRVTLDGPQGLDRQQRKYEKLNSNAHRE